jgi:hypothetical protein
MNEQSHPIFLLPEPIDDSLMASSLELHRLPSDTAKAAFHWLMFLNLAGRFPHGATISQPSIRWTRLKGNRLAIFFRADYIMIIQMIHFNPLAISVSAI